MQGLYSSGFSTFASTEYFGESWYALAGILLLLHFIALQFFPIICFTKVELKA